MRIDKHVTIVRSTTPVETTVGSEVVLMTLESGECLGLGETGSDIWRLLAKPTQLDPVVQALSETYTAPPGVIEQDVIELLEQFLDRGLIEVH
jgi:Coenzyme PQQ synthesis protein D (PqqD)